MNVMPRIILAFCCVLLVACAIANDSLTVHVIEVGQGDSILIQSPGGKTMLIDAGDDNDLAQNYLNNLNIDHLDVVLVTHPHLDHIGGLSGIVQAYQINQIIMPRYMTTTKAFENLLNAVKSKGLTITPAKAGLSFDLGEGVDVECLAPHRDKYNDENDYSVVVKITYGVVSFLLTGDAQAESENDMVEYGKQKLKSTVLKVGHHGAKTSTTERFFDAVSPEVAVISVGNDNKFGHPSPPVIERLGSIETYQTRIHGNLIFDTNGQETNVRFDSVVHPTPVKEKPSIITRIAMQNLWSTTSEAEISPALASNVVLDSIIRPVPANEKPTVTTRRRANSTTKIPSTLADNVICERVMRPVSAKKKPTVITQPKTTSSTKISSASSDTVTFDRAIRPVPVNENPTVVLQQTMISVPTIPSTSSDNVYVTATGSKYHRTECKFLSKSSIPISRSEAVKKYTPCTVCNP